VPIPSPSSLERLLAPYAGGHDLLVRVWAVEAGADGSGPSLEREFFGGSPHFVCLGACDEGLVLVRQTRETTEDLDGSRFAWERVNRVERDPHLTRDFVVVEVDGRPLRLSVTNHLLLPGNRHAAKEFSDLATRARASHVAAHDDAWSAHAAEATGPVAA
jgi:hypothetical protein